MFGDTSRMMVKYITLYWDIKQIMDLYKKKVLVVTSPLKEYVTRLLAANGYFVVCYVNTGYKRLTLDNIEAKQYGLFGSISDDIEYVRFDTVDSKPPANVNQGVEYGEWNTDHFINPFSQREKCVGTFFRRHLHIDMTDEDNSYGLLPCSLPHNGQVIVITPKIKSFPLEELIARACKANSVRNNYLVNRRNFCHIDKYNHDMPIS